LPPVAKKIGGTPSQQTTGISINLMLLGIVFLVIDLSMGIDYFVGHGTMFLIVFCSGIF
jgi:glucose uptake protein GlcU